MISRVFGRRTAAILLILAAGVLGILLLPLSSTAANPGSGTASDTNRVLTWTGALKPATAAPCKGANDASCDRYQLTVQPPPYGFSIKIVLAPWGDWDLYVYGPDGGQVGSSGNGPNQAE